MSRIGKYIPRMGAKATGGLIRRFVNIDPDTSEGARVINQVLEAYELPEEATTDEAVAEQESILSNGRTTLLQVREAMGPEVFQLQLSQVVHLKFIDGIAQAGYDNWRTVSVEGEFSDFETNDSFRYENPRDYVEQAFASGELDFEGVRELQGPSWSGGMYQKAWRVPFETTTILNLAQRLNAIFSDGVAWNRTIEKFVFNTLISSNPTITVDGTAQPLFATSRSDGSGSGSNDISGGGINALDIAGTQLRAAIVALGTQRVDGEKVAMRPRHLVVAENSANHHVAMELLDQRTERKPGGNNNEANLFHRYNIEIVATPVIDDDEWYLLADFSLQPNFAPLVAFFNGEDTPEIVDIDEGSSTHFKITRTNRWLSRGAFGGTMQDYRGIIRGSQAA